MGKKKQFTVGTISELYSYSKRPKAQRFLNGQMAIIKFESDGKTIYSENRIFVPLNSQIGDPIKIYYDKSDPQKIYRIFFQNLKRKK
ncbi:hypothetical protein [Vagococcus carniphilus]|uniref:hypothetical protein n=1 Tax=Vagococcus carniphilus TaxID=218144 RepID=UPI003BAC23E2